MREITKSVFSFSWAMSLLAMKQAVNMVNLGEPIQPRVNPMAACDPVTRTAVDQFDDSLKGVFRTGDNLQRGLVDLMFGIWNSTNWNLPRWQRTGSDSSPGNPR
jgi:hypothetical protein